MRAEREVDTCGARRTRRSWRRRWWRTWLPLRHWAAPSALCAPCDLFSSRVRPPSFSFDLCRGQLSSPQAVAVPATRTASTPKLGGKQRCDWHCVFAVLNPHFRHGKVPDLLRRACKDRYQKGTLSHRMPALQGTRRRRWQRRRLRRRWRRRAWRCTCCRARPRRCSRPCPAAALRPLRCGWRLERPRQEVGTPGWAPICLGRARRSQASSACCIPATVPQGESHATFARLCSSCTLSDPLHLHTRMRSAGAVSRGCARPQYSAWLDQHTTAEALQNIRAAVQASPADAQRAAVVPAILQLCDSK